MYYNNNNYEEYMRGVLGYNNNANSNFNTYPMYYEYDNNQNIDYESMYPAIYHELNPIVESCCSRYKNTRISKEIIDQITDQVYAQYSGTRGIESQTQSQENSKSTTTRKEEEKRSPQNNNILRDLIRILILRNLFPNRPGRPNPRPPMGPGGWLGEGLNRPGPGMPPQYQSRYY